MIPTKLRLKGFLSYQQETILDFTSLHVACISGMNGAGKSSILDAMTWCLFGEARQRNDELINLNTTTAEVEIEYQYENNTYKVYRARKRGKTTQLEFHIQQDAQWKELSERTLKATQEFINESLNMDYETFINASFFLQGKSDQFARQTPGKRKEILTKILGLEKWETYKTTALQERRELEQKKLINDSKLLEKEAELAKQEDYLSELVNLEALNEILQKKLSQQENFMTILVDQKKQFDQIEIEVTQKQASIAKLEQSIAATQTKIEEKKIQLTKNKTIINQQEEIDTKFTQLKKYQKELDNFNQKQIQHANLSQKKGAYQANYELQKQEKQSELDLLKQQADNNQAYQNNITQNIDELQKIDEQLTSLSTSLQSLDDLITQKEELKEIITNNLVENKHLKALMQDIEAHINEIESINTPNCPFCEQKLTDEHRQTIISKNQSKGTDLGNQHRHNTKETKELKQQLDNIESQIKILEQQKQKQALLEQQKQQLEKQNINLSNLLADTSPKQIQELETALANNSFASVINEKIDEIEKEIVKLDYQTAQHEQFKKEVETLLPYQEKQQALTIALATQNEIQTTLAELEDRQGSDETNKQTLEKELEVLLSSLIQFKEQDSEKSLNQKITDLEIQLKEQKQALFDNQLRIGGAQQAINNLTTIQSQKIDIEEETRTILEQISSLKEIEKAFGKEGIPALLIEQAIPEIEIRANEILRKLTNDEMTLSLITQEEYKNKKREDLRETLDIKVHDKFGTRDYEMFSGGETFRINFSLRLALSELLSKRAGAKLQTLVIDEGFGSQDEFGRQKLTEVINPIKKEFALILVITHIDSLKDAFPNRILVEKTAQGSIATIA